MAFKSSTIIDRLLLKSRPANSTTSKRKIFLKAKQKQRTLSKILNSYNNYTLYYIRRYKRTFVPNGALPYKKMKQNIEKMKKKKRKNKNNLDVNK